MEAVEPGRLGDRIREARKHAGLSQADLAQRLGTTQQTVARWEQGQTPRTRWLSELSTFLESTELAHQAVDPLQMLQMRTIGAFLTRVETGVALTDGEVAVFRTAFEAVGLEPPSGARPLPRQVVDGVADGDQ